MPEDSPSEPETRNVRLGTEGGVTMIKAMETVKRKPGLSQEEFMRHYEEVHVPLIVKHIPTLKRYVRNHVIPGSSDIVRNQTSTALPSSGLTTWKTPRKLGISGHRKPVAQYAKMKRLS
jgi:hypothetical protein